MRWLAKILVAWGALAWLPVIGFGRALDQPGIWSVEDLVGRLSEGREVELRAGASLAKKSLFVFYLEEESFLADLLEVLGAGVERVHYGGVPVDLVNPVEKDNLVPGKNALFVHMSQRMKKLLPEYSRCLREFEGWSKDELKDQRDGYIKDYFEAIDFYKTRLDDGNVSNQLLTLEARVRASGSDPEDMADYRVLCERVRQMRIPVPGELVEFPVGRGRFGNLRSWIDLDKETVRLNIAVSVFERGNPERVLDWALQTADYLPSDVRDFTSADGELLELGDEGLRRLQNQPKLVRYGGKGEFLYPGSWNWFANYFLQDRPSPPRENVMFVLRPQFSGPTGSAPRSDWAYPNSEFYAWRTKAGTLCLDSVFRSLDVFHPDYDYSMFARWMKLDNDPQGLQRGRFWLRGFEEGDPWVLATDDQLGSIQLSHKLPHSVGDTLLSLGGPSRTLLQLRMIKAFDPDLRKKELTLPFSSLTGVRATMVRDLVKRYGFLDEFDQEAALVNTQLEFHVSQFGVLVHFRRTNPLVPALRMSPVLIDYRRDGEGVSAGAGDSRQLMSPIP